MGGTESELSTGVNVMTRRELHEKISETFEPRPTTSGDWYLQASDGGHWYWTDQLDRDNEGYWDCADYDTDEAANAMLLEAMPLGSLLKRRSNGEMVWECTPNWEMGFGGDPLLVRNPDRKIAIVDAYSKWKNLV